MSCTVQVTINPASNAIEFMDPSPDHVPLEPESVPHAEGEEARTICSTQILNGRREVLIRHGSEVYRLRLTRQGKLILQK